MRGVLFLAATSYCNLFSFTQETTTCLEFWGCGMSLLVLGIVLGIIGSHIFFLPL